MKTNESSKVKFLIIRFSSIGDIVLTTPVIRCIKTQVEGAEIHFAVKSRFKEVLQANPYIDKIHSLDKNLEMLVRELKKENIDYIIDLHRNIRSFRVKLALRRLSFSFNKLNVRKWIRVNLKWNKLPDIHIVERYFETVKYFSVDNDNKGLDYFIRPEDEYDLGLKANLKTGKIVSVVIGGGHYTKQIPLEILNILIRNIQGSVILLGGKEDISKAGNLTTGQNIFNLVGKLNIGQTASVIKQSDVIVTPDTGAMHIASAFKKKVVSVWGNTIPEFGMYPYLPGPDSKLFQIEKLYCRPCSKIGFSKCPEKHFRCMRDHNAELIANAVNSI